MKVYWDPYSNSGGDWNPGQGDNPRYLGSMKPFSGSVSPGSLGFHSQNLEVGFTNDEEGTGE